MRSSSSMDFLYPLGHVVGAAAPPGNERLSPRVVPIPELESSKSAGDNAAISGLTPGAAGRRPGFSYRQPSSSYQYNAPSYGLLVGWDAQRGSLIVHYLARVPFSSPNISDDTITAA